MLKKPDWIRVRAGSPTTRFYEIKQILRESNLHTVCEEASCPNIGECFGKGTATFMIMGDKCTRRCPFCDVGHGRPDPLDVNEPENLAKTIAQAEAEVRGDHLGRPRRPARRRRRPLRRMHPQDARAVARHDDRSAGARLPRPRRPRAGNPEGRAAGRDEPQPRNDPAPVQGSAAGLRLRVQPEPAEEVQGAASRTCRPRAASWSAWARPTTRSCEVMRDMRAHDIDMLTIGQYLAPSTSHLPVRRYVHPDTFKMFEAKALRDGLLARRRRRDGAQSVPRGPAGPRRRRREHLSAGAKPARALHRQPLRARRDRACGPRSPRSASRSSHVPPFLLTGLALVIGSVPAWPLVRQWRVPARTLALGIYGLFGYPLPAVHRAAPGAAGGGQPRQLPVAAADRGAGAGGPARPAAAAAPRASRRSPASPARPSRSSAARDAGGGWSWGYLPALGSAFIWATLLAGDAARARLSHRRHRPVRPGVGRALAGLPRAARAGRARSRARDWLLIAVMGLGPLGAAFFLWDKALKLGDPRQIGILSYLTPLRRPRC